MNIVDRQAIEDLFTRLKEAERSSGPRDAEAEELIARLVQRQPSVAYYLAQTVLVQQWALNAAHDDIQRLERQGTGGGGLLAALFGGGRRSGRPARDYDGPRRQHAAQQPPGGMGFLAGASQTALGVAGGFILADMLANGNFSDQAFAEGLGPDAASDVSGGGDFGGGDFGGGGGDFGGGGD
jgi:hypothetical protein